MSVRLLLCLLEACLKVLINIDLDLLRDLFLEGQNHLCFLLQLLNQLALPVLELRTFRAADVHFTVLIVGAWVEALLGLDEVLFLLFHACLQLFIPRIQLLHDHLRDDEPFLQLIRSNIVDVTEDVAIS